MRSVTSLYSFNLYNIRELYFSNNSHKLEMIVCTSFLKGKKLYYS